MAMRMVKCPFCGYRFKADPEKRYRRGRVDIVKDAESRATSLQGKRRVDLTCPNCGEDFEVEVEG